MFDIVHEENLVPPSGWTKTITVLALLLVAAMVFSYLAAFAATGALLSAGLIDKWPPHADPRPRWMMIAFCSMTGSFTLIATVTKLAAWRQMKRLDASADAEG